MTQKEKLTKLLDEAEDQAKGLEYIFGNQVIADYLLANGVAVLPSGVDDADELTASILHCLEIADADNENVCAACKQDHLQLASWLNELKQRRSEAEAALKKME